MLKRVARVALKLSKSLQARVAPQSEWRSIEYFDESWIKRIECMAQFIPRGATVLDLGCGKQWLRDRLQGGTYIPVDYVHRTADTLVCDFNQRQFPDVAVDVCFISGCLEYLEDPSWFVSRVRACSSRCVLSYCTLEQYPELSGRASRGWKNSLTREELVDLFRAEQMALTTSTNYEKNSIFCFDKAGVAPAELDQ